MRTVRKDNPNGTYSEAHIQDDGTVEILEYDADGECTGRTYGRADPVENSNPNHDNRGRFMGAASIEFPLYYLQRMKRSGLHRIVVQEDRDSFPRKHSEHETEEAANEAARKLGIHTPLEPHLLAEFMRQTNLFE